MTNPIPFQHVTVDGGLWKQKQDMVRHTTVRAVYDRFSETHRFEALKLRWKPGDPDLPHIFWDSDAAKWIESVAYLLAKEPDPELETLAENAIADILQNADENGYFNCHFLVTEQDKRFQLRDCHELYCAGHLIEAAVAWRDATGRDDFLKGMCRYADYIARIFKTEQSAAFATPGHPELELALVKLYRATGEVRYLELSKFFIDLHGANGKDGDHLYDWAGPSYNQDEMPLRERSTAEGHSVRALYLLSGMADIAAAYQDIPLLDACKRVFQNIVTKRMYITGGIGSTHMGEAFTVDYHLPNRTAYAETCAAIALAMFCARMQAIVPDGCYGDTLERAVYNGFLSGISLDGKSFFYENPLEIDPKFHHTNSSTVFGERLPITQRMEVFECSCCPPNVTRFIASLGGVLYSQNERTFFVHHYVASHTAEIEVITDYPTDGTVKLQWKGGKRQLALRIPGWCSGFTLNHPYILDKGYAFLELDGPCEILLDMEMPVKVVQANRQVHDCAGRIAVTRGPVVYCIEGVDNGEDLKSVSIDIHGAFSEEDRPFYFPTLRTTGYRPASSDQLYADASENVEAFSLRLIPYYAFANRGETEMQVWLLRK